MDFDEQSAALLWEKLKEKDEFTAKHSKRVSKIVKEFAEYLGLDANTVRDLKQAALLHDVGKLEISEDTFRKVKTGKNLSEEDLKIFRTHIRQSHLINDFENVPQIVSDTLMYHHEKYDGSGYPHKLSGESIPFGVRLISIADYYDSILITRHYKTPIGMKPINKDDAIRLMIENAAVRFDPKILAKFISFIVSCNQDQFYDSKEMDNPLLLRI